MHTLLVPLILGSTLLAQQEPKIPRPMVVEPILKPQDPLESQPGSTIPGRPAPAADAGSSVPWAFDAGSETQARPNFPGAITAPIYDEPQPGQVWVLAPQWKAGFTPQGATFVPFFGSDAPRNLPADFQVRAAHVAGVPLATAGGEVRRDGEIVSIAHAGFVERYVVSNAGIEQQFVFADLPARGALCVEIAVDGEYQVTAAGRGLQFTGERGSFAYGAPLAVDAAGDSVPMTAHYQAGVLRLEVPATFVQKARLPLVIDPLIGSVVTLATASVRCAATDLAYDSSLAQHVACYERVFSQTDSDVIAMRLDANLQPVGSAFAIDNTTTSWRGCRIANLNAYDKFLVVAESETQGQLIAIAGRVYTAANNTIGSQFDIERGARSCIRPDVGGDPSPAVPTFWTVVFERRYSATDGDIMMRQVTESGALRGTGMTTIDATVARHEAPVISRSNGVGSSTQQRWLIAYLEDSGGGQVRCQGKFISWDGQIVDTLPNRAWEFSGARRTVAVSSQTAVAHGRLYAIVFGWEDLATSKVRLSLDAVAADGSSVSYNMVVSDGTVDTTEPTIETDGYRFVLAYAKRLSVSGRNVVAHTYDLWHPANSGVMPFHLRNTVQVGSSNADAIGLAVCSRYTGGLGGPAGSDAEHALLWVENGGGPGDTLVASRYLGHSTTGGMSTRTTGCGLGTPTATTSSYLGQLGSQNTFSVPNPSGLVGWVIGLPVSAPIAGCPGCTQGSSAFVTTLGPQAQFNVPYVSTFVGMTFALQAFAFGPGTCLGSLAFSDTADLTIR